MSKVVNINVSQSLINMVTDHSVCPYAVKLKFVDRYKTEPTLSMLKGNVFEYKLVGSTTNGDAVALPRLVKGGLSQAEKDIDEVVDQARDVCAKIGVDLLNGRREYILVGTLSGQLDWVAKDFINREQEAIYDFKYTETKYDDRWDGWANFEGKKEAQIQARHYIFLYFKKYGKYVPFYFLIFGKSGWMRIIKVQITEESLEVHQAAIDYTGNQIIEFSVQGWPARPSYDKCRDCRVAEFCAKKQILPDVEVYEL